MVHRARTQLGFATALLAYNALSLLKRCVERAHQEKQPELDVSTYHLATQVSPRSVATFRRGQKKDKPKPYVDAAVVRKHLPTARVLRDAKVKTP